MTKTANKIRRTSTSIYLREDVLEAIDNWIEIKEKEIGGKFTRSSFLETAIMAKVEEYGLLKETKPSTA